MKQGVSRRDFNRLLGAGAAFGTLGGLTTPSRADTRLRYIWWGNPDRDKRTLAAVDLYKTKDAAVSINPETYAWADYWPKLATQAAGGNLADVLQMDYRYIFEWARRGQLADLTPHLGNELHMENFDKNQLDSGKVDDKLYGISMGANSVAVVYNVTKYKAAQDRSPRTPRSGPTPTTRSSPKTCSHTSKAVFTSPPTVVMLRRLWRCSCAAAARRSIATTASLHMMSATSQTTGTSGSRCRMTASRRHPISRHSTSQARWKRRC